MLSFGMALENMDVFHGPWRALENMGKI